MSENDRARALIANTLDLPVDEVPTDAAIGGLRGWDSLGHVKIILAVEGALGRPLRAAEIAVLRALPDIATLLKA